MSRLLPRALVASVSALLLLPWPGRGGAAPLSLRVRAPVRCALSLSREAAGVAFQLHLVDDREAGVAGAPVRLQLLGAAGEGAAPAPAQLRGRTDGSGVFAGRLPWSRVQGRAVATFDGDERAGPCATRREFDLRRAFPRVTLTGPREVREGRAAVAGARFEATVDSPGAQLLARLWRVDGWRQVATGSPDPAGRFRFSLEGAHAQGVGPATLRVEVLPDERRNGASADRPVLLSRPVQLELRAPAEAGVDGSVALAGSLRTPAGGLEGGVVSLLREGAAIATLVADRQGRFTAALPARLLGEGPVTLQAAYEPAAPGYTPATSAPRKLLVLPAAGLGGRLGLLGGALLALAVGLALWLRRRPRGGAGTVVAPRVGPLGRPPEGALQPLRRLLRRLTSSRVAQGLVVDGPSAGPLGGVALRCGELRAASDPFGRFALGPLEGDGAVVRFEASGYAPELVTFDVPVVEERLVALWPWRERLLRDFGEAAALVLPGPALGLRTPAELRAAALAAARLAPEAREAVLTLVALLEEACYSPRGADAATALAAAPHLAALRAAAMVSSSGAQLPRPPRPEDGGGTRTPAVGA